jgi:aminopeptidase-like protein
MVKKPYLFAKEKLFHICRSITGKGIKKSLGLIKKELPLLKIFSIKSKTKVFDWVVPPEWNIDEAYVLDKNNKKIIDFKKNNLHVVNYSIPVKKILTKNQLINKIYSLKDQKKAIPYVTSYYKKNWGFCASYNQKNEIIKNYKNLDKFSVLIKSSLNNKGNLNYGELILKGKSKQEILISTYLCHPSMANNELSGPIVSMALINYFSKKKLNKTLRFIFIPETIGSIVYLSKKLNYLKKWVVGGFNLTCIGDERQHSCMFTKYGNTLSDDSLRLAYKQLKLKYKSYSFLKRGSDERQYNSPGIDLPIASIFRSKYGEYKEYHTSEDNFKLVTVKGLTGGFKVAKNAILNLDKKIIPINKVLCEPQMSKRGMYNTLSQKTNSKGSKIFLSFLQYSDGKNDLEKISQFLKINVSLAKKLYVNLVKRKLLR